MPLIETVPNLVNGVSQQAEDLRFSSQASEQTNFMSEVVEGLVKRPPLEHIGKLNSAGTVNSYNFVHFINLSDTERFVLIAREDDAQQPVLEVFDLDGNAISVVNSQGNPVSAADLAYLASATHTMRDDLKALTVADYTFLLNKKKVVAMDGTTTTARDPEALVFLKQTRVQTNYTLRLYSTPGGAVTYTGTYTVPEFPWSQGSVMDTILTSLSNAGALNEFTIERFESLLHIKKNDGSDFRVEFESDAPETVYTFKDNVQDFSLLPEKSYVGVNLLVQGNPQDENDDYYIEYFSRWPAVIGFTEGSWRESVKQGIEKAFDATTLPHKLTWDGTKFTFAPIAWDVRLCGDDDSNPKPSFVGREINDLFFHRNRFGFLSGENVILSESGSYFNFWRTTVISLLDSDPIDIGASTSQIAILRHVGFTAEKIVLFSEHVQFTLPGDDLLTPKTARLVPIGANLCLNTCEPLTMGNSLFFPFNRGSGCGVNEFTVDDLNGIFTAEDVSGHVPTYIAGDIYQMAGAKDHSILFAAATGDPGGLYVYRFYDQGKERLQSAWFRFDFGVSNNVRGFFIRDNWLYVVMARADGTYLERLNMQPNVKDSNTEFMVYLDRKTTEASCSAISYTSATDETAFTLPYTPDSGADINFVTRATRANTQVYLIPVKRVEGNVAYLAGDRSADTFWIGQKYQAKYTPNRPALRQRGPRGDTILKAGRFQVQQGRLNYSQSSFFTVQVTPKWGSTYTYEFTSRTIREGDSLVGRQMEPKDGVFPFPVRAKNDEVTISFINDSPFPSKFLTIDWTGHYQTKYGRIS